MSSQSLAFYLKYRPQTLDGLIGQESVKKTLLSAFQSGKLSHAYLFVGPRGTGKTSTARILAKMVNCERSTVYSLQSTAEDGRRKTEDGIPCNKCNFCISITDGSFLDLIEIDAASNRGIEDIRSLRERIKLSPSGGKKKVYIIDEVHMLTPEAFNALLKTLEEPPAHALFILATTEVQKLPQTILSRVQRLDFRLATSDEIIQALERIAKEEKLNIDKETLKLLAKKAEGSFRDGIKVLDQVSVSEKVTVEMVGQLLSSSQFEETVKLLTFLAEKKVTESLKDITEKRDVGIDIKEFNLSLMDILRSLMLIKSDLGLVLVKTEYSEEKYQQLEELAGKFTLAQIIRNLNILQSAFEKLKTTSIPSLPLEIAIVEICSSLETQQFRDSASQRVSGSENSDISGVKESFALDHQITSSAPTRTIRYTETPISADTQESPDIIKIKEKWNFVLETIRPYNFSLEALLRSVAIAECSNISVVLEVPYSFHQRILEAPKNRDLLESILSEILGRSIKVTTVLGQRPPQKEDVANIEVAADDEIIRIASEIFSSDSVN